jgi:SAM-dependent methyltransferase
MGWINSIKEHLLLAGIYFKVLAFNFTEYVKVVARYYSNSAFRRCDLSLLSLYLFQSPFRISKQFLLHQGSADLYTYGETPLTTLDSIAKRAGLHSRDVVLELGCGRGRTCFWLHHFIGCQVIGIEYVPAFVDKASRVKNKYQIGGVAFRLEDLFHSDLQGATVIYLYGSCFSSEEISLLIKRFSKLPAGTKIITVSYALTDYQPSAPFRLLKQFPGRFTWGTAMVSVQAKS